MPFPSHDQLLGLCCRACGKRNIWRSGHPERFLYPVASVATALKWLHEDADLDEEPADTYPKRVCKQCHDKLAREMSHMDGNLYNKVCFQRLSLIMLSSLTFNFVFRSKARSSVGTAPCSP